jgi:hypothetical protein
MKVRLTWINRGTIVVRHNKWKGIRLKVKTYRFDFPCHFCDVRDDLRYCDSSITNKNKCLCLMIDPDPSRHLYFQRINNEDNKEK